MSWWWIFQKSSMLTEKSSVCSEAEATLSASVRPLSGSSRRKEKLMRDLRQISSSAHLASKATPLRCARWMEDGGGKRQLGKGGEGIHQHHSKTMKAETKEKT